MRMRTQQSILLVVVDVMKYSLWMESAIDRSVAVELGADNEFTTDSNVPGRSLGLGYGTPRVRGS